MKTRLFKAVPVQGGMISRWVVGVHVADGARYDETNSFPAIPCIPYEGGKEIVIHWPEVIECVPENPFMRFVYTGKFHLFGVSQDEEQGKVELYYLSFTEVL